MDNVSDDAQNITKESGLSLKRRVVTYTDTQENQFALRLYELIHKYCKLNCDFDDDEFCCVDYKITSRQNPAEVMYLELKSRHPKFVTVNSFLIGHNKMINIHQNNYNKCILIWDFNVDLFFRQYNKKLINYKQKFLQSSSCIDINKSECSRGINNLAKEIYKMLKIDTENAEIL